MRALLFVLLILPLLPTVALGASDPFAGAGNGVGLDSAPPKFLPVAKAYPTDARIDGNDLVIEWDITPGYYLYKQSMQFKATGADGALEIAPNLPTGEPHEDEFFGKTEVYRDFTELRIAMPSTNDWTLELRSQGCADAGLCYPPRKQYFDVFPSTGAVNLASTPLYAPTGSATSAPTPKPSTAEAKAPLAETVATVPTPTPAVGASFLYMALLAAMGGMILNLMPCVFPVLSLKVLKLSSAHDGSSRLTHCIAYTAGVVLSFVAVALVLVSLRGAGAAIGWGFHLQSPIFVGALVYLFLAMGLGLSGLVNLGSSVMGAGGSLADKQGYAGTFFTGILATVVASPCTAPFMGTALGFAMTQPAVVALGIFAALGLGMATPFVVFAMSPALMRLLPKPGAWMESFKQFIAFPLYAAAVWLLWVLGKQAGVNAMALVAAGGVLLAMALWILEGAARADHPWNRRIIAGLIAVAALLLLRSPQLDHREQVSASGDDWEAYSEQRFDELRAAGEPIFINMTADWCITCLANERVALSSSTVTEAFQKRGIRYLKGDWTNADPVITELLARHGRTGVPLYLIYGRNSDAPVILPQILTPGVVIEGLDAAGIRAPGPAPQLSDTAK